MSKALNSKTNVALRRRGKLLVGYLLAGYPSREDFLEALRLCALSGVDIIEVGMPSVDPLSDGDVIRAANREADMSILDDGDYWRDIRRAVDIPIWVMGYNRELVDTPRCLRLAKDGVADAFVLPGLTAAERQQLAVQLAPYECDVLGFVNPDTPTKEVRACFRDAALVYAQLYVGQTGAKAVEDRFRPMLSIAGEYPETAVFAGFGISTGERARFLLSQGFDGAIIGTAMVKKQNESPAALRSYIEGLKSEITRGDPL